MQLQRRLTADEEADAVSKYQTGASMAELARELGVHKATVSRLLDRAGIPKRQPGLGSDQLEEAIELYADGWSLAAIGRRFKVDGHTVAARLREAGIEIRATGRRC